jgi:branched-chain amino acid aminotransferase
MSEDNVYLNGRIVPAGAAAVSVFDAGLLHGASTFTTMLAHNGVVFRFERHLARLTDTVKLLKLRTDATAETLRAGTHELLRANGLSEARLRITITPGSPREDRPTTVISAEPLPDYPAWWYERGIPVVVTSFKQAPGDVVYGYKTGCYLPRILARQEAAAKGAEEALWFTTANFLAEACFCNVFLVLGGKVVTPPIDTPVLPGVLREAVLELCSRLGVPHDDQTRLTVKEMLAAEEVFLTGSCSGVRPVIKIERHDVGEGRPGDVTRHIMSEYRQLLDAECAGPGSPDTSD